jgi:23S rRNA (guanosine2251-2'-O)-methyltransferase
VTLPGLERPALKEFARTLRDLTTKGVWILGADTGGESLFEADVSGPVAWVFGAEGTGLRRLTREHCDRIVGIPLRGSVESLNVSVASGICLYATRRARSATTAIAEKQRAP